MIREDLYPAAQKAIQFLVIQGRAMAYENAPQKRIASLLDDVEYLIGMLYEPSECTTDFQRYLDGTTSRFGARHYYQEFVAQLGEPVSSESTTN
jgi:hypothetical protein